MDASFNSAEEEITAVNERAEKPTIPVKLRGIPVGEATILEDGSLSVRVDDNDLTREIFDRQDYQSFSIAEPQETNNRTLSNDEIEHRFGFHKATVEGANATLPVHKELRLTFRALAEKLDALLPPGRAKSVCLTELETTAMWAHKANAELSPLVEE